MNFQTMSKQRKFVLIAAAVGIISMFLPWISFLGFNINGMHGSGILVFLCFVASGIITLLGDQTKNLEKTMWGITLIAGAIALLIILYFFIEASGNGNIFGSVGFGFGVYISGLAAIGVLISAYLFRSPTDNIKDSFNSMKKNIENKMGNTGSTTPTPPPPPPPPSSGTYQDPGNTNPPV
jgi:peptidoglycan/LPS O-acetylase OafA/YrhL